MWYGSLASVLDLRGSINRHCWDEQFTLKTQRQHVYDPEDVRSEFIPFKVPRLGPAYDFSGFWDYPSRMGWKVHRSDRCCHEGRCPPGVCTEDGRDPYGLQTPSVSKHGTGEVTVLEKVTVLQSWLFFGALAEACTISGLTVDRHIFSMDIFDTGYLNGLPLRMFAAAQRSRRAGRKQLKEELYFIIRQIQLMVTRSSDWEDELEYDWEQCQVLFSISVLLRTLSLALLCHSRHSYLDRHEHLKLSVADVAIDWKSEGQMSTMALAYGRLAGNGWCKVDVWHVLQRIDVAAFACALERPHALQNHEGCTDATCFAYQVDDKNYHTLHVESDCDCPFVDVELTSLRDMLARDRIPAILVSDDLKLGVVDAAETTFVAISHVWADGLGNPFQNSLPACQIRRLHRLTTTLCETYRLRKRVQGVGRLALWIDTLCIPVAPAFKEYRKLAIRMLARTYTEASGVLVLDRELCRFASRQASLVELSIRVACSGWLRRLWTLQEASLAGSEDGSDGSGRLYIQMADGPAHWNRLSRSFHYAPSQRPPRRQRPTPCSVSVQEVKTDLVYGMHLLTAMEDRLPSVRNLRDPRFDTRLEMIARAVQNRTTSKREDEPVCMAGLLGLDLASILRIDDADARMAEFYMLMRDIPSAVIFAEFGVPEFQARCLPRAPFRWAPHSLLSLERPMEISLAVSARRFTAGDGPPCPLLGVCEEDGLHVQHLGFVLDGVDLVLPRDAALVEQGSGEQYHLSLALSDMAPESVALVGRCALVFKTEINSDAVIVCIESEVIRGSAKEYRVMIVGHGTVKAWRDADRVVRLAIGDSQALAGCNRERSEVVLYLTRSTSGKLHVTW